MTSRPQSPTASDALTDDVLAEFAAIDDPALRLALNAVTKSGIDESSLDRAKVVATPRVISNRLDDWAITSQKKSGRCWLFSSLNLLRATTRAKLGVKDFEFSQNYAMFWDKFERANFFLTDIIATASEPLDSRLIQFLLADVLGDGGQWDMAVSVYQKHGVIPKEAMPETQASSCTHRMNTQLQTLLRRSALELREQVNSGASSEDLAAIKKAVLGEVWRILVISLGNPPSSFEWEWIDDDKAFHRDGVLTPAEFYDRYVGIDLTNYVCLVDDPRTEHPKGAALTVEHLGNVVGGREIRYINAPMTTIKKLAADAICSGEPVWFGADVSKQGDRDLGLLVGNLHDYSGLFGVDLSTTKEQRVNTGESAMNHAMLFTGVDLADAGTPRRWRVENSWGDEPGDKGFFTMDDAWLSDYVFEVVVKIDALPDDLRPAVASDPIKLPAWDPMGTLA
ncbi:C1 family peptidase [Propionimicrobium sp. PCR01-08-3]|uniref:aminopeptidase C n=1 Tax=Propionimicrobium sp. PCR01-08-3 TaxID=3052086 RepID=UPI00255CDD88|nr:C1 family peptidase [Propionimicrobium sp. PCR01-08-3]WIY83086.1 C1 family peptidase [Propionimicrobium sp. PCR01-08-3]